MTKYQGIGQRKIHPSIKLVTHILGYLALILEKETG